MPSRVTRGGMERDDASRDMIEDKVWTTGSVARDA
jgi:hypothetical protein